MDVMYALGIGTAFGASVAGTVDESMITGEPVPAVKRVGSKVTAGTINRSGVLRFTAQRVGEATMLANIIRIVREVQSSRPPHCSWGGKSTPGSGEIWSGPLHTMPPSSPLPPVFSIRSGTSYSDRNSRGLPRRLVR
ncbi:MAG: hypothetical protein JXA18_04305 [Chitinispirillaceae bacterium]|nr:hypothetical protein [Chitinispirillaceae bacterium]